jgi:hypothetical protein
LELKREIELKVQSKPYNKARERKMTVYEEWCITTGQKAFPVTKDTVTGFLCQHVVNNNGSTRSVATVKSMLKKGCEQRGHAWLSALDNGSVLEHMRELAKVDMSEGAQKRALQRESIQRIVDKGDLQDTVFLYVCVLLETGHDGLLRSGEMLSGVKATNILWKHDKKGFRMEVLWTKTGGPALIDYDDYGGMNAVTFMMHWFDQHGLWDKPEAHVFPAVTSAGRFDFTRTASLSWLRRRIKIAVASIGLDPKKYSGHSLRAGGATDLFVARVPYYIIKKKGRWVSDSAMQYYRDEEDIQEEVSKAFALWK